MKKLLALLLAALMLTGCAVSSASSQPIPFPAASTSASTAPDGLPAPQISTCSGHDCDPYTDVDTDAFYESYTTACCYVDAQYRSAHYLMSGLLEVPDQYAVTADTQPMEGTAFIRNTASIYLDGGNTYLIYDAQGNEVLRIHRGGAYITLEEVAAYVYAFGGAEGSIPANYVSQRLSTVGTSPWGQWLRGNHSAFSGNTKKYPYEPVLPNISGCGGELQYFEMDIGTTGTVTDGHSSKPYNDGTRITRGAARLVYARQDLDGDGMYSQDEVYVFYTANHYNDFREYLNYFGGWGEEFGNITGGGTLSSKKDFNPTAYVPTAYANLTAPLQNAA